MNTLRIHRRRMLAAAAAAVASMAVPRTADAAQRKPWPPSQATPTLELPLLDGGIWRLDAVRGEVVALNFWASWCPPCRDEMPSLELMATRHEHQGLVVAAVNFKESAATIRRFTDTTLVTMPIVRDADGAAAKAWGVRMFPTTVLVDRDGRAAFSVVGEIDWTDEPARGWVETLLREPGAPVRT
jgi:thiol-disulfide isomerase/thioredoxin